MREECRPFCKLSFIHENAAANYNFFVTKCIIKYSRWVKETEENSYEASFCRPSSLTQ